MANFEIYKMRTKSSVDATLGGNSVGASGEQLGYAGGLETSLGTAHGGTKTGTTSANNAGIVLVVN
jgi:hypothetical protein